MFRTIMTRSVIVLTGIGGRLILSGISNNGRCEMPEIMFFFKFLVLHLCCAKKFLVVLFLEWIFQQIVKKDSDVTPTLR